MPSTIRDLTELTVVATDDYLLISDTSDVVNRDKRISKSNLLSNISGNGLIATGGFTLTVPATGIASLLGVAQTSTALKAFSAGLTLGAGSDVLNNYVQGTWTPVITASGGNPIVTYTGQVGQYTRIGNCYLYYLAIAITTISGGAGQYRFSLPAVAVNAAPAAVAHMSSVDVPGTPVTMIFRPDTGQAYGRFYFTNDNAAETAFSVPALVAGSSVVVSGFFFV